MHVLTEQQSTANDAASVWPLPRVHTPPRVRNRDGVVGRRNP